MAAVTEPVPTSADEINEQILRTLQPPTALYVLGVLACVGLVGAAVFALAYQTYWGSVTWTVMH